MVVGNDEKPKERVSRREEKEAFKDLADSEFASRGSSHNIDLTQIPGQKVRS